MSKTKALAATFRPDNIAVRVWSAASIGRPMSVRFTTKTVELNAVDYLTTDNAPADDVAGAALTTSVEWSYDENGQSFIDMSQLETVDLDFFTVVGPEEERHQFSGAEINDMMDVIVKELQKPEYLEFMLEAIAEAVTEWENDTAPF